MKTENLNRIKILLEKYELGKTSLDEEGVLINYFQSEEIPPELLNYQAEFNYYAAFQNIQFTGSLTENIKTAESSILRKIIQFFSKWYVLAVIVLLPCIGFMLTYSNRQTEEPQTPNYPEDQTTSLLPNTSADVSTNQPIDPQLDEVALTSMTDSLSYKTIHSPTDSPAHLSQTDSSTNPQRPEILVANENYPVAPDLPAFYKKDSTKISAQTMNTFISVDSSTANGIDLKHSNRTYSLSEQKEVFFNLTENSTSGELAKIAHWADKAGIEYTYIVDMHKKKIHELNIVMVIRSTQDRSQLWISVPKKSNFSEILSWTVDENGLAVSLCANKIEHKAKARHPIE